MGQALQKVRGGSGALQRGVKKPHHANSNNITSDPAVAKTVRQSVEVKPEAPEPRAYNCSERVNDITKMADEFRTYSFNERIIEPLPIKGEWDRNDPSYSAMMQQVVGKITTRPAGEQEMGSAHVTAMHHRPRPANRQTSAATGPDEEKVVAAGTLNIVGIQEALRLYQGLNESNKMDVKALAERFNVDPVLLERVFKYTSLPVAQQRDPSKKLRA